MIYVITLELLILGGIIGAMLARWNIVPLPRRPLPRTDGVERLCRVLAALRKERAATGETIRLK